MFAGSLCNLDEARVNDDSKKRRDERFFAHRAGLIMVIF